jgi:hypothetical protein
MRRYVSGYPGIVSNGHNGAARAARTPRLLSAAERDALVAVLSHADFAGRAALLEQVDAARVVGGCDCGCATVDLAIEHAPPSDAIAYPIPSEATILDAHGEAIGGVLVFARDGYLTQLEVYGNGDEPINPFPPIDRLALTAITR